MGSLILCHNKRAKQPFEIKQVHQKIYTIEELCYYICNNLYLIDHTLMNKRLCNWLERELELVELSASLREELHRNCSEEQFVLTLLQGANLYALSEINKIQSVMDKLKTQSRVEKLKYKADTLLSGGECQTAVLVYQSILHSERDDSVKKEFYGKVYGCLGSAYGRQFLYKEASESYRKAYEICKESHMLKAYLYCCQKAYPEVEYVKMLSGNPMYLSMDAVLKAEKENQRDAFIPKLDENQLEIWKMEYRRGEGLKKL